MAVAGGGKSGSSPSGIAPLPHSNFEHPWYFKTFPPSPPPSPEKSPLCRKFWVPCPIPPHSKNSPCPILPSVENFSLPALYCPHHKCFSSLPYSPLCRKVFAPYPQLIEFQLFYNLHFYKTLTLYKLSYPLPPSEI